jgi:hypothetical protein
MTPTEAEAQGQCSDCAGKLERPLNPARPDVCIRCYFKWSRFSTWKAEQSRKPT